VFVQTQLQSQLIDRRAEISALRTETEFLRGKLVSRDEELEDVRCQFTSVNNALEVRNVCVGDTVKFEMLVQYKV